MVLYYPETKSLFYLCVIYNTTIIWLYFTKLPGFPAPSIIWITHDWLSRDDCSISWLSMNVKTQPHPRISRFYWLWFSARKKKKTWFNFIFCICNKLRSHLLKACSFWRRVNNRVQKKMKSSAKYTRTLKLCGLLCSKHWRIHMNWICGSFDEFMSEYGQRWRDAVSDWRSADPETSEFLFSWADLLVRLDQGKTCSERSAVYGSKQSTVLHATSGIIIFGTKTKIRGGKNKSLWVFKLLNKNHTRGVSFHHVRNAGVNKQAVCLPWNQELASVQTGRPRKVCNVSADKRPFRLVKTHKVWTKAHSRGSFHPSLQSVIKELYLFLFICYLRNTQRRSSHTF